MSKEEIDEECKVNPHCLRALNDETRIYFIGIIDYFQLYDYKKAFERFIKRLAKCNPRLDTSSQPPKIYATRFLNFMRTIIT